MNEKKELIVPARLDALDQVLAFIDEELEHHQCPMKIQMQIDIAVEEIYVNIAHYAYDPAKKGTATISFSVGGDPLQVIIQFMDDGIPYNPLEKPDPDTTLKAEERQIGGLGIFLVKKSMDNIQYEYKDGKNVLTIGKILGS